MKQVSLRDFADVFVIQRLASDITPGKTLQVIVDPLASAAYYTIVDSRAVTIATFTLHELDQAIERYNELP